MIFLADNTTAFLDTAMSCRRFIASIFCSIAVGLTIFLCDYNGCEKHFDTIVLATNKRRLSTIFISIL